MKGTTFNTSCSFSKWEWKTYGDFESYLNESTKSVKSCWALLHTLSIATPTDISEKNENGTEPIPYLTELIDECLETFQSYVFKYTEANMVKECFDISDSKESFFNDYCINVTIPYAKINDYEKLVDEIDRATKKEDKLICELYSLCFATPKDIAPEKSVPFDWVNEKFDSLFDELITTYDLHARLILMQNECLYSDDVCYNGMDNEERKRFFFKKKVLVS